MIWGEQKKRNGNAMWRCRWHETNRSNGAYGTDKRLLYLFAGGVVTRAVGEEDYLIYTFPALLPKRRM